MNQDHWIREIEDIGSSSSPRAIDLNHDGTLDIVVGGGGREYAPTEYGVIALDGKNGELLWSVPARNQVIGSPIFMDINRDDTPDVFIGGRSAILYAVNGRTGNLIWEFLPNSDSLDIVNDRSILNFYNLQFIPDQDGDGLEDILTAYGGFIKAQPTDPDRPAASLMVISSKTGKALANVEMPDGRETYMSPLVYDFEGNGEMSVIFGSGGETLNGHFYKASLNSIMKEDLSGVKVLAGGKGKGFIAPPVLADITHDGIKDIIVSLVNGKVLGFDGSTEQLLWETDIGSEFIGYAMPAPGFFNSDNTLDFFVSFGHGVMPAMDFTYQLILDGKNGSIIFEDSLGTFQYASPVAFDFTGDNRDDALVVINSRIDQTSVFPSMENYINEMRIIDPHNNEEYRFHKRKMGSNLGSTPLLTDLDKDGYLDVIYVYMGDAWNFYSFQFVEIERIETSIKLNQHIRWGEYMGAGYDGVYR